MGLGLYLILHLIVIIRVNDFKSGGGEQCWRGEFMNVGQCIFLTTDDTDTNRIIGGGTRRRGVLYPVFTCEIGGSVGNAFDAEPRVLEVKQESGFEPRDIQVSEHLRDVAFVKIANHLGVHNHPLGNDEVWNQ